MAGILMAVCSASDDNIQNSKITHPLVWRSPEGIRVKRYGGWGGGYPGMYGGGGYPGMYGGGYPGGYGGGGYGGGFPMGGSYGSSSWGSYSSSKSGGFSSFNNGYFGR
uniref:CX domain-containing protein n=1 Tax=Caenorhabditis tropicalis TaxID=1561998 RepID=A0A1I7TSQ7_9PELO